MTVAIAVAVAVALAAGLTAGRLLRRHGPRPRIRREAEPPVRRILLPFTGLTISRRALEAAMRLALAEHATLMPAFLATVPRQMPLDSPLPKTCGAVLPLLEAIEHKATTRGVPVDSRIGRGRSHRDALRRLLAEEHVDRVVVPASADARSGFTSQDIVWLLERAPAEVVILRPAPADLTSLTASPAQAPNRYPTPGSVRT
jgi:Universal stress protein family